MVNLVTSNDNSWNQTYIQYTSCPIAGSCKDSCANSSSNACIRRLMARVSKCPEKETSSRSLNPIPTLRCARSTALRSGASILALRSSSFPAAKEPQLHCLDSKALFIQGDGGDGSDRLIQLEIRNARIHTLIHVHVRRQKRTWLETAQDVTVYLLEVPSFSYEQSTGIIEALKGLN